MSTSQRSKVHEPIAIVGIGCRFPGANGPLAFWQRLEAGYDAASEQSDTLLAKRRELCADQRWTREPCLRRTILLDGIDRFDRAFFGITQRQATRTDPQHRLLLEVCWEAFEDAGCKRETMRGSRTGVFIAQIHDDYDRLQRAHAEALDLISLVGTSRNAAAAQLAYCFALVGPALVIDTDRSSALAAVHIACQSLRAGECEQAIVGAANLLLAADTTLAFEHAGMLSRTGRCRFADRAADGFVRSEGVAAVVLKPLAAVAPDDAVYALVRGSAMSCDGGRSGDLMRPSVEAQSDLLAAACRAAAVDPHEIDYVEAHGTGTVIGDRTELAALEHFRRGADAGRRPCLVGSVKTNIGHTEAASGLAGLIKTALALRHACWPQSLHYDQPPAELRLHDLGLRVVTAPTPFASCSRPALAGVSSFGLTGTNVHVVLQQHEAHAEPGMCRQHGAGGARVIPLSAHNEAALRKRTAATVNWLAEADAPPELYDLAYTASLRRTHFCHRLAVVARSSQQARERLRAFLDGRPASGVRIGGGHTPCPKLAFVFSGEDSLWPGMGTQLLSAESAFRETFELCDLTFRERSGSSFLEALRLAGVFPDSHVASALLASLQISLAKLWASWGVEADTIIAIDGGEIAAACVAGIIDIPGAMELACLRGRALAEVAECHASLEVRAPARSIDEMLAAHGSTALVTTTLSPACSVVTVKRDQVDRLTSELAIRQIAYRLRPFPDLRRAHATQLADAFGSAFSQVSTYAAEVSFLTASGARLARGECLSAAPWQGPIAAHATLTEPILQALQDGVRQFLELSPHPVLKPALDDVFASSEEPVEVLGSLRALDDEQAQLFETLAALYVSGRTIDWARLFRTPGTSLRLPPYAWDQQRFWSIDNVEVDAASGAAPRVTAVGREDQELAPASPAPLPANQQPPHQLHGTQKLLEIVTSAVELSIGQGEPIPVETPLRELGVTSVMLMEIRETIARKVGRPLRATLLLEHPTVRSLVDHLRAVLSEPQGERASSAALDGAPPAASPDAIAIIGMGCRFPGGASTPEAFWHLLCSGIDPIREVPPERWPAADYYDQDLSAPGKSQSKWGGFIADVDMFDPQFFSISPREAERMDPQQRLLLEVVWESLEHAGVAAPSLQASRTGVFVGICNNDDYAQIKRAGSLSQIHAHDGTGEAVSIAAGRIAYFLGLRGPCLAVDTACSSSLVAVHLACQSLRSGESTMAIAAGVNLMLTPRLHIAYGKARMLSPTGRCRTFDAAADGYVRSEGCGVVVLKRLRDALRSGDKVWAVIHGSAVNQDGRSNGLTAPSAAAQEACLRAAYTAAAISPSQVSFVEAHGTGTPLGDPIEVQTLQAVLCTGREPGRPFVLGSVKTNIGHLEAAAGMAGLIKTVLALGSDKIPGNLHLRRASPLIEWSAEHCRPAGDAAPWPSGPRVAGVSSFGFSGTNAHVVLGPGPDDAKPSSRSHARHPLHILTLSARSDLALAALSTRYVAHLARLEQTLADEGDEQIAAASCFTANHGRAHWNRRVAVVGASTRELRERLQERAAAALPAESAPPTLAFMFTGQGSQYVGMGKELYEIHPRFRDTLQQCAELVRDQLEHPLLEVMFEPRLAESHLHQTAYAQPALFALEYALSTLWSSWGLRPAAVLGHSVGELAAACFAGLVSLEDGMRWIVQRGRLMQSLPQGGGMLAVLASVTRVDQELAPYRGSVAIAAVNAPANVVISGPIAQLEEIGRRFAEDGVRCAPLQVSHAFHSPLMEPILDQFEHVVAQTRFGQPTIPIISNLTGKVADPMELRQPRYWSRHIRETVRFEDSVRSLQQLGCNTFLELGPKPTLTGMAKLCIDAQSALWLPSLLKAGADWSSSLQTLATLYERGADVDWAAFYAGYPQRRVVLPTYPFQRTRCWCDAGSAGSNPQPPPRAITHPYLVFAAPNAGETIAEGVLDRERLPVLEQHRLHDVVVVPAVLFVEAMLSTAQHLRSNCPFHLKEFVIHRALTFAEESTQIAVQMRVLSLDALTFKLEFRCCDAPEQEQPAWTCHASAELQFEPDCTLERPQRPLAELTPPCDGELLYRDLAERGLQLGAAFQTISSLSRDACGMELELAPIPSVWPEGFAMHPAMMDAPLQALAAVAGSSELFVPVRFAKLSFLPHVGASREPLSCVMARRGEVTADLHFQNGDGAVLLRISGAEVQPLSKALLDRLAGRAETSCADTVASTWTFTWQRAEPTPCSPHPPGPWLIAETGASELAHELAAQLPESTVLAASDAVAQELQRAAQARPYVGLVYLAKGNADDVRGDPLRLTSRALKLLQAISSTKWQTDSAAVWIATQGAQAVVPGEGCSDLAAASLWGLGRVFFQEHMDVRGGLLDLDCTAPCAQNAASLINAISSGRAPMQRALRGGLSYAVSIAAMDLPDTTPAAPQLYPQKTYLITGGCGALGRDLAERLTRWGARHLLLLSRSGPSPHALRLRRELAARYDAHVELATGDVSKLADLADLLRKIARDGKVLGGVFHLAGVVEDAAMNKQNDATLARVLAPKVDGAWNLHMLTRDLEIEHFVLYSSMAAIVGHRGQANYAAANAFLDALAHWRRCAGLPAQSINWGPWAEIGMAAQEHRTRQYRDDWGVRAIPPGRAMNQLARHISTHHTQLLIAAIERDALEAKPRWSRLLADSVDAPAERGSDRPAEAGDVLASELARRDTQARRGLLSEHVLEVTSQVLGLPRDALAPYQPLNEMGLDSLLAIDITKALEKRLGSRLPLDLLLQAPSVQDIVEYIEQRVA